MQEIGGCRGITNYNHRFAMSITRSEVTEAVLRSVLCTNTFSSFQFFSKVQKFDRAPPRWDLQQR